MIRKLFVLAGLVAGTVLGQSNDPMSGHAWKEWSYGMRAGYVIGFSAGHAIAWAQLTSMTTAQFDQASWLHQCTKTTTFAQEVIIMDKYLLAHPKELDKNISVLFRDAIEQACDLPKTK